jgi:hypothetical protein
VPAGVPAEQRDEHALLILSTDESTRVLSTGDQLQEVTDQFEVRSDRATLDTFNLFSRAKIAQVHSRGLRLLEGAQVVQDIDLEPDEPAVVASSAADPYVVLLLANGAVQLLTCRADVQMLSVARIFRRAACRRAAQLAGGTDAGDCGGSVRAPNDAARAGSVRAAHAERARRRRRRCAHVGARRNVTRRRRRQRWRRRHKTGRNDRRGGGAGALWRCGATTSSASAASTTASRRLSRRNQWWRRSRWWSTRTSASRTKRRTFCL